MQKPSDTYLAQRRKRLPILKRQTERRIAECERKLAAAQTKRAVTIWTNRGNQARKELIEIEQELRGELVPVIDGGFIKLVKPE